MKRCTKCQHEQVENKFSPHKSTKDGLQSWCRNCVSVKSRFLNAKRRQARRARFGQIVVPVEARCGTCKKTLSASCFSCDKGGPNGLFGRCKSCCREHLQQHTAAPFQKCIRCHETKLTADFSRQGGRVNGLQSDCKACVASKLKKPVKVCHCILTQALLASLGSAVIASHAQSCRPSRLPQTNSAASVPDSYQMRILASTDNGQLGSLQVARLASTRVSQALAQAWQHWHTISVWF